MTTEAKPELQPNIGPRPQDNIRDKIMEEALVQFPRLRIYINPAERSDTVNKSGHKQEIIRDFDKDPIFQEALVKNPRLREIFERSVKPSNKVR